MKMQWWPKSVRKKGLGSPEQRHSFSFSTSLSPPHKTILPQTTLDLSPTFRHEGSDALDKARKQQTLVQEMERPDRWRAIVSLTTPESMRCIGTVYPGLEAVFDHAWPIYVRMIWSPAAWVWTYSAWISRSLGRSDFRRDSLDVNCVPRGVWP